MPKNDLILRHFDTIPTRVDINAGQVDINAG
jgi:hypothetical protein